MGKGLELLPHPHSVSPRTEASGHDWGGTLPLGSWVFPLFTSSKQCLQELPSPSQIGQSPFDRTESEIGAVFSLPAIIPFLLLKILHYKVSFLRSKLTK